MGMPNIRLGMPKIRVGMPKFQRGMPNCIKIALLTQYEIKRWRNSLRRLLKIFSF